MKNITLFSRYKRMINLMLADGQQHYTSSELNTHVGQYEDGSRWKQMNNNPYYTTRTYQTMLKDLGCISMVRRGLWKINAPIPEWFSSLHLSALSNSGSRKSLEKSSFVWQNMPQEHKINPWNQIPAQNNNNMQNNENFTINAKHTGNISFYELTIDFPAELAEHIPNGKFHATMQDSDDGSVDLLEWHYSFNGVEISPAVMQQLISSAPIAMHSGKHDSPMNYALDLQMRFLAAARAFVPTQNDTVPQIPPVAPVSAEPTVVFTKESFNAFLEGFAKNIVKDLSYVVESQINDIHAPEVLDIYFDKYSLSLEVELCADKIIGGLDFTETIEECTESAMNTYFPDNQEVTNPTNIA
jgi:hypothetical protein